jgi:hypothetical protein
MDHGSHVLDRQGRLMRRPACGIEGQKAPPADPWATHFTLR